MVDSKAAHVERGPTHSTLPSPPSTPGIDDGGSTVKKRKREAVEQVDNIPRKKKESVGSAGVGEPTAAASTSSGSTKNSSGTKNGTRLLANFIVAALGERLRGDFQNFQHLLTVFKDVPVGGDGGGDATEERGAVRGTTGSTIQAQRQRQRWLRALTQTVSHLGRKEYAPLVDAVLAVNVAGAARAMTIDGELLDMTFVDVYTSFLENLVSAHAFYTQSVLRKLVEMIRGDDDDVRDIHSRDKPLVTRIHATLRTVLHIVPSASALLVPILAELFPHKRESVSVHDRYVRNLIRVVEYAPAIRDPVLEFMMEHALQIDVEITLDMDDMDEEDERLMVELDGKRDPTDDTDGDESDHASELGEDFQGDDSDGDMADTGEDRVETLRRMKEMMAKLDRVLTTIFDFYQDHLRLGKRCLEQQRAGDDGDDGESFADDEERTAARACTTSDPAPSDLLSLFMTTITTFDRCVLRTHKAKYTQSLLFYLCSLHHTLPDTLLGVLITRVFDPTLATYLRCTSAAYLASYLARAKYVPPETIAQCLRLCTDWVHSTLDRIERRARGPNPHKHPVFYAVVQAILYIFCFRWRELVVANEADNTGNIQGDTTILLASAKQAHGTDFTAAPLTSSSPDVNWYDAHQSGIISASHIAQRRTSISSTTSPSQQQPQPLGVTGPNMDWWRLRGGFERIIYSRLNPLKVCARNVVREFDAISQRLQLVYCSSLIYANKAAAAFAAAGAGDEEEAWSKLPPSALAARRAAVETQSTNGKSATVTTESGTQQTGKTVDVQLEDIIESFFPFDPYYTHLSYSSAIEKLYVPWRGCVEDDEEAEDDEENVDDQEEADDEDKDAAADEQDETDDGNATEDAE